LPAARKLAAVRLPEAALRGNPVRARVEVREGGLEEAPGAKEELLRWLLEAGGSGAVIARRRGALLRVEARRGGCG
jgi:hypothetical protein